MPRIYFAIIFVFLIIFPTNGQYYNGNVSAEKIIYELSKNHTYSNDHIIIEKDLDISNLKLKNISFIRINDSKFLGKLKLENIIVKVSTDFSNTIFQDDATFQNSSLENANFQGCNFTGSANFEEAQFERNIMPGAIFYKYANFYKATFLDSANFRDVVFKDTALFADSRFDQQAQFYNTNFAGSPDFAGMNIAEAYFSNSKINGTANFDDTIIGKMWFYRVYFGNDVLFRDSSIKKALEIIRCQFKGDAILEGSQFNPSSIFNLDGNQFGKLYIRWNYINKELTYNDEAYLFLIKNYKTLGLFDDANNCYFQYRTERRSNGKLSIDSKLNLIYSGMDFAQEITYGYGTKPLSALVVSVISILIFSFLFLVSRFSWQKSKSTPEYDNNYYYEGIIFKYLDFFWYIKFSFLTFLSGTKLFVNAPNLPEISGKRKDLFNSLYILERILGGILFALFVLALTRTVILQDI
jgi:uncharacterized protein YjbI with pentapeptide repeats